MFKEKKFGANLIKNKMARYNKTKKGRESWSTLVRRQANKKKGK